MSDGTEPPCVLLAEDEMVVAMMLEDMLKLWGYRVITAARVTTAMKWIASEPIDIAVLDINLNGQTSFVLADELARRDIPYVFSSGYGETGIPAAYREAMILQKPYVMEELQRVLKKLLGS